MEEEKKVEVEVVDPQENKPQNEEMLPQNKNALVAFILSIAGFTVSSAWLFSAAAVVLGIVALNYLQLNKEEPEEQPFRTFGRIAKPVAIVDICLGAVLFVVYLIVLIVKIVNPGE